MSEEHQWVEQRFLGLALGTLEDASRSRLEAHMAKCTECSERYAEFRSEQGAAGHLPAAMIARWDRARPTLSGLERESVRLHLQHCDFCREELKLVGQAAAMDFGTAPAARASHPVLAQRRRATTWAPWLGGGAIGAMATAAALLLLVQTPRTIPPEPLPIKPTSNDNAAVAAGTTPQLLPMPWISPASLRGDAVSLALPDSTNALVLALAVPARADGAASRLRIHGPDGRTVAATALGDDAVRAGTAIVLLRNSTGLQSGSYRVVLLEADVAQEPDSTESYFELEIRP